MHLEAFSSSSHIPPPTHTKHKQVGASQKLTCVIDGESLMNDGSALVIFLLLQKIVEGEPVTVGGVSKPNTFHESLCVDCRTHCPKCIRTSAQLTHVFNSAMHSHSFSDPPSPRPSPSSACWRLWACSWESPLAPPRLGCWTTFSGTPPSPPSSRC